MKTTNKQPLFGIFNFEIEAFHDLLLNVFQGLKRPYPISIF